MVCACRDGTEEAGVSRENRKETAPRFPIGHWWGGGRGGALLSRPTPYCSNKNTRDAAQTERSHHISQPIHPLPTPLQLCKMLAWGHPAPGVLGGFRRQLERRAAKDLDFTRDTVVSYCGNFVSKVAT